MMFTSEEFDKAIALAPSKSSGMSKERYRAGRIVSAPAITGKASLTISDLYIAISKSFSPPTRN